MALTLEEVKNLLLEKKIIRTISSGIGWNPRPGDGKSYRDLLQEIDDDGFWEYYNKFPDDRYFIYCLNHNITEIPRCPICGDIVKLNDQGTKFFRKTCSKMSCQNEIKRRKALIKYGVENVAQAQEVKDKKKELSLAKFGTPTPLMNEEIKEKINQSLISHYGEDYRKIISNKRIETCIERYGVSNPSQVKEFQNKKKARYAYDGLQFRSSYELIYYLYNKDLGKDIKYESLSISYKDSKGNTHFYYPDFVIDGKIIEIKGNHLLKNNHIDSSVYNNSAEQKDLDRCKQACIEENGVIIIKENQIKEMEKYVINYYGKSFIRECKNDRA